MSLRPARSRPFAVILALSAALLLMGVPTASLASDAPHSVLANPNFVDWMP